MAMKRAVLLLSFVLLVAASNMFDTGMANKNMTNEAANWNHTTATNYFWGFHRPNKNETKGPKTFIVGGADQNWHFGFNYTDWAIKNGPFYLNDKLVFRYDPPNGTTFPHSVYLLPNYWSFMNCDLRMAKKVGDVNQGGGEGFEFELKRWQPYYFACGEHDGIHCKDGMMKFAVWPLIRWYY